MRLASGLNSEFGTGFESGVVRGHAKPSATPGPIQRPHQPRHDPIDLGVDEKAQQRSWVPEQRLRRHLGLHGVQRRIRGWWRSRGILGAGYRGRAPRDAAPLAPDEGHPGRQMEAGSPAGCGGSGTSGKLPAAPALARRQMPDSGLHRIPGGYEGIRHQPDEKVRPARDAQPTELPTDT